jgi:hypothetical protein
MFSETPRMDGSVNYQRAIRDPTDQVNADGKWYGKANGDIDLMVIWLGTNDADTVGGKIGANQASAAAIQSRLEAEFKTIMEYRRASHYLLVKIDGMRHNSTEKARPCVGSENGTIRTETCQRDAVNNAGVACINAAIEALEQTYHNVHVAEVDFTVERCPGGETPQASPPVYLHFGRNDSVAMSIFGRIMCHAVFNRDTGDLRWVGAVPTAKKGDVELPKLG